MSVMQKLMEINDELVRVREERDRLREERLDQKTLQEICSMGRQRITELQDELRKACAERDQAVENAVRLQAELDATRKQLQNVLFEQEDICSAKPAGQNDLVRDVSHYIEAAEVDRPTEPQFKPYTFAAYIVGDKSQPDALRIVWATEEWIQHSQFGIVHRMRDMHLFDNGGGCNITEYHETLTLSLEVQ